MKVKFREDAKKQIREAIASVKPILSEIPLELRTELVNELEEEIRTKHPEIDSYYQNKVKYACVNIRHLAYYKLVQE